MKLIEKLKNVFFEEVPEDEDEEELPQTFAKKIEVPKKVEPPKVQEFKREEKPVIHEEIEIEEEEDNNSLLEEEEDKKEESVFPMMFDDDDFLEDEKDMDDTREIPVTYKREDREERELYQGKRELSYIESVRKPNYSHTKSYYEEKETKGFRPSPIISPVYGVLDKNYRKEEVVAKKETKVSIGRNNNFDLDAVRNKAFGRDDEEISDKKTRESKVEDEKEDKKIYDVNNNKPQVNRVTLADADEYYNDLGLAYNVDYSDASRNNNTRTAKYNNKNNKKDKDVDDNLFDLIDSMYNKED